MWESDDLQESKWQSDSIELERRRRRKMRNGGEGGEETGGGKMLPIIMKLCCSQVSFFKRQRCGNIYLYNNHNFL